MFNLESLKLKELQPSTSPLDYMALCPFHDDKKAGSFFINIQSGMYHCFSCGAKGFAINIAKKTGGQIKQISDYQIRHFKKLIDNKWRQWLLQPLATNNSYLLKRGVNNDLIKYFDIRESDYGIAFPLKDFIGNIIGFQERTYSGVPSRYHLWGEKPRFYINEPIDKFAESEKIFIVEGIFGVINAHKHGYKATTMLGATSYDIQTIRLLRDYNCVVLYDNDEAGINGTRELVRLGVGKIGGLIPGAATDEITKYSFDEYYNQEPIYDFNIIKTPSK